MEKESSKELNEIKDLLKDLANQLKDGQTSDKELKGYKERLEKWLEKEEK